MAKNVKVIFKSPNAVAEIVTVEDKLTEYQRLVGGPIEQVIYPACVINSAFPQVYIICNEDGRDHIQLAPNIDTPELMGGCIVGNFFVTKVDRFGYFTDLTKFETEAVLADLQLRHLNLNFGDFGLTFERGRDET